MAFRKRDEISGEKAVMRAINSVFRAWLNPPGKVASAIQFAAPRAGRLGAVLRATLFAVAMATAQQAGAQVTTSQYDNARTGANTQETALTPSNVDAKQFGKIHTFVVDGDIYAQPLFLHGLEFPGKGKHNAVFVATEHDSVFAFDADGKSSEPLWKTSFAHPDAGITPLTTRDVHCLFISPEIGITSTPVIDASSATIYVLARTKERGQYVQKLHALTMATGAEQRGSPVTIGASVKGRGEGSKSGRLDFDPLLENPRAALLLANRMVYLTWASSCDVGSYHGWVMAYDARTLAQVAVFNDSADDSQSGIWQSDAGPAADDSGNVFLATGNGGFNANSGGRDYGDSALKLDGHNLAVRDYFTPFNQRHLDNADDDLGSGGPVLLPDQEGAHPHELVVAGKGRTIYVVDRDRMGRFHAGSDNQIVQSLRGAVGSLFAAPAWWNGHLYFLGDDGILKDFHVDHGMLSSAPVARSASRLTGPGATPEVSANGSRDGIVWVIESSGRRQGVQPAVLRAYDAGNVAHEIYNSEQNARRDRPGVGLHFAVPTIANGHVYVGTKGQLDIYGLLQIPE
jgi:hypothetical protein